MSVKSLAQSLQAQGRNGDSVLVHMTPREVGGLQALAKAHGGSLTTNPTTGLPEANFLEAILPTVLGIGLSFTPLGPLASAGLVGGGTALATGDVGKGLMAGLGAYGGAGLGSSLQSLGAAAPGSAAMGALGDEAVASGLMGSATDIAATAPVTAAPTGFAANAANAKAGLQAAAQAPGQFLSNNLTNIGMAAAPMMGAFNQQTEMPEPEKGDIRQFDYTQEVNPEFGMPGQPYFNQYYTPGAVTPAEDFEGFADGGGVKGPYKRPTRTVDPAVTQYNQQLMQRAQAEYNQAPQLAAFRSALPNQGVYDPQAGAAFQKRQAAMAAPKTQPEATQFGFRYDPATGKVVQDKSNMPEKEEGASGLLGMMFGAAGLDNSANPFYYARDEDDDAFRNAGGGIMRLARGGYTLGDYSDGGRLLRGPGDGVSDDIPATIEGKQPARLAEGEFVIPARIVSEIGNGSTEAGAKRLYAMMDRVQKNRAKTVGKDRVAKDTRSYKELPA